MGVTVLDREMFTEAEAARLLRVSQNTLNYWLEGGEYRGRRYRPVIREQARGSRAPVTWAEFVEAGLRRPERCRELVLRGSGRPRLPPLGKARRRFRGQYLRRLRRLSGRDQSRRA